MSYALTSHEISDIFNDTSDLGFPVALNLSPTDQQQKIKDAARELCAVVFSTNPHPQLPSYSPQQKWPETTVSRTLLSTITVASPYYNEYPGADYHRHPHQAVHPHQHQHSQHHNGHSNVAIQALTHQVHHQQQHPQQQPRHTQLPPHHQPHHRQYGHQVYPAFSEEPRGLDSLGEINEPLPPVQTVAHHSRSHIYGTKPRARTHGQLELGGLGLAEDEDDQDGVGQHYQHQHHSHHHHISDLPPPSKIPRNGHQMGGGPGSLGSVSPSFSGGPQNSANGTSGSTTGRSVGSGMSNSPQQHHQQMPSPAQRPRGPKIKFTPEDDTLLVDLKENKSLTWKQIAEFFPGRSSGTLQVRYCTRLKAKTTQWNDETIQKLRTAMAEYETDRWRMIAAKVGGGFTAAACKEKALELEEMGGGVGANGGVVNVVPGGVGVGSVNGNGLSVQGAPLDIPDTLPPQHQQHTMVSFGEVKIEDKNREIMHHDHHGHPGHGGHGGPVPDLGGGHQQP